WSGSEVVFFFQAEDGIRDRNVTGVQTCALPILKGTYAGSATYPASFGVTVFSGEFTADGASTTGNISGHEDVGAPSGSVSDEVRSEERRVGKEWRCGGGRDV